MTPTDDQVDESGAESTSSFPGVFKRVDQVPETMDPVVREWNMHMNVSPDVHVIVLRYPEKLVNTPYTDLLKTKPIEFRIKPLYGLIEVDVPVNPHADTFDKMKGLLYGEAMRKSKILKERGGSYGIAGGFGLGGSYAKNRAGASGGQTTSGAEPTFKELLDDWEQAVNDGHVLTKITLGGHINVWNETSPNLYVGHFQDANVFFTKVDALCVLRPQLAHLDAINDMAKCTLRMQAGADTEENEAVHVNVTIKKLENEYADTSTDVGEVSKLLKAMREEPWQRLSWVDSEAQESYSKFNEAFTPGKPSRRSQLTCNMTNDQWLDAISCPRIDPINPDQRGMKTGQQEQADLSSTDPSEDDEDVVSIGSDGGSGDE